MVRNLSEIILNQIKNNKSIKLAHKIAITFKKCVYLLISMVKLLDTCVQLSQRVGLWQILSRGLYFSPREYTVCVFIGNCHS